MTLVVDKFRTLIPPRAKSSPSGWTSFNAPCCQHRGHSPDTRKRAGIRFDGNGIVYNCFNCKFTTGWQPGSPFGEKMKSLARWLGAGEDDVKTMVFEALKTEAEDYEPLEYQPQIEFSNKELPEGSMSLRDWLESAILTDAEISENIMPAIDYIISRGFDPLSNDFYWSPASGYTDRVIVPFRWNGNVVGNTARKIIDGRPKYLSDQHPHFVFNFDRQKEDQKYILVCEGPFDALSINGVALLTNDIADQQARIINSLNAEVIVIPDQDEAGLQLIDRAIYYNWSVSFPNWDNDIKDVADAVKKYGRLFVIVDAVKTAQKGEIKIKMYKKQLEQKLERLKNDNKIN
jgi:hypothetical protein